MPLSEVAALALVIGSPHLTQFPHLAQVSWTQTAPADCSMSITLADWGQNSNGYIDIKSGQSCQFPIRMRGTVSAADISQKPAHGKLKKLGASTFEYRAKARYRGSDTFAIKVTGQAPAASGTSVITVHATIN